MSIVKCLAYNGSVAISLILSIILSIGLKAKSFASLLKLKAPKVKTKQTKRVLTIFKIESVWTSFSLLMVAE